MGAGKAPFVIGVSGGTGSGKTTVSRRIQEAVNINHIAYIQHDNYYRDQSNVPLDQRARTNYDHPDSLETELLVQHLLSLRAGQAIDMPQYDFSLHTRSTQTQHVEPAPVILIEGILIFVEKELRDLIDVRIFVDTDADVRFIRRLRRDMNERGRSLDSVVKQYMGTVRPMHMEFVEPSKRYADIIVPRGGDNRVAMEMIVSRIDALLEGLSVLDVLYDLSPAVHQGAGLARYAERLATHMLADQADQVQLRFFYNAHGGHLPPPALRTTPCLTLPLTQIAWRLSVLASQIRRQAYTPIQHQLRSGPTTIYHATEHLLPRLDNPTVLTVHDLIFERFPQHHTRRNRLFLRVAMPLFVQAASAIVAVSRHTRRDLVELYGADPAKIHVVYEGVDARFEPAAPGDIRRVTERYSPDRPYLLMVGTLEPRKNHAIALRALARLKAWGWPHRLLLVGGQGWLFEPIRLQIEASGLDDDVHFAGYVPDADLPPLYSGAAVVLVPSLYEGFGFPVLEAQACGAAVVCSNASSLPEVAGGAALLVNPEDDEDLAHAMHLLLSQPAVAYALGEMGRKQAGRFRWDTCARETVGVYRQCVW